MPLKAGSRIKHRSPEPNHTRSDAGLSLDIQRQLIVDGETFATCNKVTGKWEQGTYEDLRGSFTIERVIPPFAVQEKEVS